jgi:heat shock protein HslJ
MFGEDGSLNGSVGCNTYSSSYTVNGNAITVVLPTLSQRLCAKPDGIMEQERAFLAAVQTAATFELLVDELILRDASGATAVDSVRP